MPELPEVETVRRQLHHGLRNKTITRVQLLKTGREKPVGQAFVHTLQGQKITAVERRAKLLVWRLENSQAIIAHLKMTGRFTFQPEKYTPLKHDRAVFSLSDTTTTLVWADTRQFGFMRVVSAIELNKILATYGPEPLETSTKVLADVFKSSSTRTIKAALLDQTLIAGIGNIYADETCHRAGIRPTRRVHTLTAQERLRLAHAIQEVLRASLERRGTSANDYVDTQGKKGGFVSILRVYGREGKPCRNCKSIIKKMALAQRGTHYCANCQK